MSSLNADLAWVLIIAIAAWMVLGCLKAIGYGYYNAVLWHNLRIQVHDLRIEQKRRLTELDDAGSADSPSARSVASVEVIDVDPVGEEQLETGETPDAAAA
jgi:hypothetical protein